MQDPEPTIAEREQHDTARWWARHVSNTNTLVGLVGAGTVGVALTGGPPGGPGSLALEPHPLYELAMVICAVSYLALFALGVRGRILAHFGDRRCRFVHGLAAGIGVLLAANAVVPPVVAPPVGRPVWEAAWALGCAGSPAILAAVPNLLLLALFWKVLGGPAEPE